MKIEYKGIEFECEFDYENSEEDTNVLGGHNLTYVTLAWDDTNLIDVIGPNAIEYFEMYAEGRYE